MLCSPHTDGHTDGHADIQTDIQTDTNLIQRTPFQGFRNFSFNLSSRIGPIFSKHYVPKSKLCSVAHLHTDRHKSEYIGHPFRVSGIFPSTYHQGSVQ